MPEEPRQPDPRPDESPADVGRALPADKPSMPAKDSEALEGEARAEPSSGPRPRAAGDADIPPLTPPDSSLSTLFPSDLPDPRVHFDPAQWAMHGLLAEHFEETPVDRRRRADAVLSRVNVKPRGTHTPAWETIPVSRRAAISRRLIAQVGRALPAIARWCENPFSHPPPRESLPATRPQHFRLSAFRRFGFRRFSSRPRRWLAAGGASLAAAAGIIIAVTLFWHSAPQAMAADLLADAANAGTAMFYFARDLSGLFSDDPALARQYHQTIEDEKRKRDAAIAIVERTRDDNTREFGDVFTAWQALYCGLRDLGLREESIRENENAIAYCRNNPTGRRFTQMEPVYLDGLGNTLAAFGDYPAARKAYLDSLALRQASPGNSNDPHQGEPGYEGDKVMAVTLLYCRLVMLSIAEGDLPQAGQWQKRAETCVRQWVRTTCELNMVAAPPDASLWDLWNALPAEYHNPRKPLPSEEDLKSPSWPYPRYFPPSDSQFHLIGAVLYHEAVLQRLSGGYAAAHHALDHAETLSDVLTLWPGNDEYHLPLLFRLELTRLAIIEKDYAEALRQLDRVEQYDAAIRNFFARDAAGRGGPTVPDVHKLPLSPLRRAEMNILRGVALLGLEEAGSVGPPWPTGDVGRVPPASAPSGHADARIPSRTATGETPMPQLEGEAQEREAREGEAPAEPGRGPRHRAAGPSQTTDIGRVPPASAPSGLGTQPSAISTQPSLPMTPRRAEALALIHRSLALPEKLAAALPADQREAFLKQFEPWRQLAESPTCSATTSTATSQEKGR